MEKLPFVTKEKAEEIAAQFPTPFHLYDERGIRENAAKLKEAFAWNKGYKEFFATTWAVSSTWMTLPILKQWKKPAASCPAK